VTSPTTGVGYISQLQLEPHSGNAQSATEGSNTAMAAAAALLLEEVTLAYLRCMNKLIFDANLRGATTGNDQLSALRLIGDPPLSGPPERGVVSVPVYDFPTKFGNFSFKTFLTNVQVKGEGCRRAGGAGEVIAV
jgi:hypothetical protein